MFKRLRGVNLPAKKQGLIRFTCLTYDTQPQRVKQKIKKLCEQCGGEYADALFSVMCTERSITKISLLNNVGESTLYRARKNFYESW